MATSTTRGRRLRALRPACRGHAHAPATRACTRSTSCASTARTSDDRWTVALESASASAVPAGGSVDVGVVRRRPGRCVGGRPDAHHRRGGPAPTTRVQTDVDRHHARPRCRCPWVPGQAGRSPRRCWAASMPRPWPWVPSSSRSATRRRRLTCTTVSPWPARATPGPSRDDPTTFTVELADRSPCPSGASSSTRLRAPGLRADSAARLRPAAVHGRHELRRRAVR